MSFGKVGTSRVFQSQALDQSRLCTWLLCAKVIVGVAAILGARLDRDSRGHTCCFFITSTVAGGRRPPRKGWLGVEEILEEGDQPDLLSDAWLLSAARSPPGPNPYLHLHILNISHAVHVISRQ